MSKICGKFCILFLKIDYHNVYVYREREREKGRKRGRERMRNRDGRDRIQDNIHERQLPHY